MRWVRLRWACVSPRRLTEPPRTCGGGDRRGERCNWYEGQLKETILSQPLAASSLCGGSLWEALRKAAMTVQTRHGRFAICWFRPFRSLRRQVAAALSAAVTTTKQQETAPTSHGREPPTEQTSLFPATLRERGSGGEALLLEKRPLPQNLLAVPSLAYFLYFSPRRPLARAVTSVGCWASRVWVVSKRMGGATSKTWR